jgi:hypothetical protein
MDGIQDSSTPKSIALVGGSGSSANPNSSSFVGFTLASLVSITDE